MTQIPTRAVPPHAAGTSTAAATTPGTAAATRTGTAERSRGGDRAADANGPSLFPPSAPAGTVPLVPAAPDRPGRPCPAVRTARIGPAEDPLVHDIVQVNPSVQIGRRTCSRCGRADVIVRRVLLPRPRTWQYDLHTRPDAHEKASGATPRRP